MKKVLLILIVIAGFIEGCRYKEGPLISFRSALNRIYGNHILTKYTVDGIDSLKLYHDSLGLCFDFFYSIDAELNACDIEGTRNDGKISTLGWRWDLINNGKNLLVTFSGSQ